MQLTTAQTIANQVEKAVVMGKYKQAIETREVEAELAQELVDDTTWACLAGIIDGEGPISASLIHDKARNREYIRPYILIGNSNPKLFDYLSRRIVQGNITKSKPIEGKKIVYRWQVSNWQSIKLILKNTLPFLVLKWDQATLLLELSEKRHDQRSIKGKAIKDDHGKFSGREKVGVHPDDLKYWEKLKILNERGTPTLGSQVSFGENDKEAN